MSFYYYLYQRDKAALELPHRSERRQSDTPPEELLCASPSYTLRTAKMLAARSALRRAGLRAFSTAGSEKIAMVGSGNFGSALVRILGSNALRHPVFDDEVRMYVYEEMIEGKKLTEIINEQNENVKYLKGAKFTPNVKAVPDVGEAVSGATMVCFCLPHQFLKPLMPQIKVSASAVKREGAVALRAQACS